VTGIALNEVTKREEEEEKKKLKKILRSIPGLGSILYQKYT
jgi:hypothetical protein